MGHLFVDSVEMGHNNLSEGMCPLMSGDAPQSVAISVFGLPKVFVTTARSISAYLRSILLPSLPPSSS